MSSWRRARPLIIAGLAGVISLVPSLIALVREKGVVVADIGLPAQVLVLMVNPVLYLCIAAAIGARLSARLGLRSHLVDAWTTGAPLLRTTWRATAPEIRRAVWIGLALGASIVLADAIAFRPHMTESWRNMTATSRWSTTELLSGVFFGGITEEIVMRWGVLAGIAALLARMTPPRTSGVSPVVLWSAIAISAIFFAAGHLPYAEAIGPLEPVLVVRTFVLNGIGGLVFGWLFVRYSLESAMIAHASTHIAFAIVAQIAGIVHRL